MRSSCVPRRASGRHVLVSTPAQLARFPGLLALAQWQRPEMIFSSGGPLAPETAALYRAAFGAAPVEVFGSTETGGVAWRRRDGGADEEGWQAVRRHRRQRRPGGALRARLGLPADAQLAHGRRPRRCWATAASCFAAGSTAW
jgi:acyl-coenzyme A synthetase/AMP-(fatty) acid ligase